jgi:translation initiation factor IF-3
LFKEQGEVLLLRFANDLEEAGRVEQMPILEGKRMTIMFTPKKAGAPAPPPLKPVVKKVIHAPKPKADTDNETSEIVK